MDPLATVVISTKNRKDELRNAIVSALRQSVVPEIVVFDDGSTDGTSEMVRQEFPQARLERVEQSLGIIGARNKAIAIARAPVVITIDDDCVFPTPRIIEQTLADFDHPRIGAVGIPSIDVLRSPIVWGQAPDAVHRYICPQFRGGSNAMLREVFLRLGGYRAALFRQGEEDDYCQRLLNAGYVVRMGRAEPIHHLESPTRNQGQIGYYQGRSRMLILWYNCPALLLPYQVAGSVIKMGRRGWQHRCFLSTLHGIGAGIAAAMRQFNQRAPADWHRNAVWRRLRKVGIIKLEDLLPDLPPMR